MCTLARHDTQPRLYFELPHGLPAGTIANTTMADLEKLAIQRDRGYLVRLVLLLGVGLLVAAFVFQWLTGANVTSCVATSFGAESSAPAK